MATVSSLTVKIGANISELQTAMKRVSTSVQQAGRRMTSLGRTISTRVTAPLTALAAVSVRAFGEQEKAELRLRAALQANGRQVDQLFQKYNQFAQQMQAITVIGDETTLAMLAQAESLGLTGDAAERAVRNSIAMQSAFGVNAESALRYTAALEQGNATMLTRYIPTLRDIEDESERAAKAQEVLGRAFSAAEAEGQSVSGMFVRLKNAVGDALEDIGESVSEAFNFQEVIPRAIERVNELRDTFQRLSAEARRRIILITAAIAGIGPALVAVGVTVTALGAVIGALTSPIAVVIGAIGAMGAAFIHVHQNWEAVKERISDLAWLQNLLIDMVQLVNKLNPFQMLIDSYNFLARRLGMDEIQTSFNENLDSMRMEVGQFEHEFSSFTDSVLGFIDDMSGVDLAEMFRLGEMPEMTNFEDTNAGAFQEELEAIDRAMEDILGDGVDTTHRLTEGFQEAEVAGRSMGEGIAETFSRALFFGQKLSDTVNNLLRQFASQAFVAGIGALAGGGGFSLAGVVGSVFGVNDAMITSRGDVVKFHPDDNILAMKDFSNMGGGASAGDMERAFSTALGKFASRLGPDEVWVLNQRGAQLRGRLG